MLTRSSLSCQLLSACSLNKPKCHCLPLGTNDESDIHDIRAREEDSLLSIQLPEQHLHSLLKRQRMSSVASKCVCHVCSINYLNIIEGKRSLFLSLGPQPQ